MNEILSLKSPEQQAYKFAHIFPINSPLYNRNIQKLICESQNKAEHIFIYLHEKSFNLVKDENLGKSVLVPTVYSAEIIKEALHVAKFAVIHSMEFPNTEIAKLSDSEARSCIWSVWGPDLYRYLRIPPKRNFIYEFARLSYHLLKYRHITTRKMILNQIAVADAKIAQFCALCAGFEGDIAKLKERFPDTYIHQAVYPGEYSLEYVASLKQECPKTETDNKKTRILIGHCAAEILQHEKWIKKLAGTKDIEIYLPLNYGNQKYGDKIESLAKQYFANNAVVFREPLPFERYYTEILASVDIAIFDMNISNGYGNALYLMYLGKKVFYPENSVMYKNLSQNGAVVFKTEDFDIENLKSLDSGEKEKNKLFATKRLDFKCISEQWKALFAFATENLLTIAKQTSFYSKEELKTLGLKALGSNVLISRKCSIYSPQTISIGNNVRIDDFCILSGNITIGDYCHISAYSALYGSKGIVLEGYCGISPRCVVLSATDDFSGDYLVGAQFPDEYTNVQGGAVVIKKYAQLAANTVVLPNNTIEEGSVTGAMTLVNKSLEPWTINTGIPVNKTHPRNKGLLDKVAKLNSQNMRGGGTSI